MKLEPFSAILSDFTSKYNKIKKEDYLSEGKFPIIDQGQKFIGGYTDDGGLITDIEKELIIFGDHTKILKFIDFPIAIGADGVKVLHINKEKADPRYIYYFLKSVKLTDAGYSRHFKFLKEIKIPLPENINDQIKIARLLNHVEKLILQRKESIALLDELVKSTFFEMFGDVLTNSKNLPLIDFEKLVRLKRGYDLPKQLRTFGIYPVYASNSIIDYHNDFKVKGPGVITGRSGTIGTVNYTKTEFWPLNTTLYSEKFNGNIIYIKYFLEYFRLERFSNGAGVPTLNRNLLHNEKIIDAPRDLQNQFATIVEKVENIKIDYNSSLIELENMYGVLSQKAFNTEFILNQESDAIKKKGEEVMEQDNLEQYSKSIDLKKEKVDITNMSYAEYLDFPEELQIKNETWMFTFLGEDEFYQFLLKDGFKDTSFTLGDLETKFHNFFYHGGDMDFDNEKWKEIIFKFLEADPPLIEQIFDQDDKIIKLKLTDEAFKA